MWHTNMVWLTLDYDNERLFLTLGERKVEVSGTFECYRLPEKSKESTDKKQNETIKTSTWWTTCANAAVDKSEIRSENYNSEDIEVRSKRDHNETCAVSDE